MSNHTSPSGRPPGHALFLTGLSGSGKSTLARGAAAVRPGLVVIDGDELRALAPIGFDRLARAANVRTAALVTAKLVEQGMDVVCALIAPYAEDRALAAAAVRRYGQFLLVHVATPLHECRRRDPKGLYAAADAGRLAGLTGVDDVYEEPTDAEVALRIDTTSMSVDAAVARVLHLLPADLHQVAAGEVHFDPVDRIPQGRPAVR